MRIWTDLEDDSENGFDFGVGADEVDRLPLQKEGEISGELKFTHVDTLFIAKQKKKERETRRREKKGRKRRMNE